MQFIAQKTQISVPKVYCAFKRKNKAYIVMEKMRGDMLCNVWGNLSEDSQDRILTHLRLLIHDMRQLQPTTTHVSNIDGGPLWDGRIPGPGFYVGPFDTQEQFHRYLRRDITQPIDGHPEIAQLIEMHKKEWPLCFTHADLSSFNILVRDDRVIAIIDWATSGWYPAYWEFTTAITMVNPQNTFWGGYVDKFLERFPQELEMEKIRQRYFGEI